MDSNTPRVIRYSYSNSSFSQQDDSVNITKDLERSSVGTYEQTQNNLQMSPTLQSRMNERESQARQLIKQRQIEQLEAKLRLMEGKYEKSLQQISLVLEENKSLQIQLTTTQSMLNMEKSQMQNSKNIQLQRMKYESQNTKHEQVSAKLQQIRRLKDSIMVLEKERNSYRNQSNQLAWRVTELKQLQKTNEDYQNKLALLSQQLERLTRLNKEKNLKQSRYLKEKEQLDREIRELRSQNANLKDILQISSSEMQGKYHTIIEQRNAQIQQLNQKIIKIETKLRDSEQVFKDKKHSLILENQKIQAKLQIESEQKQKYIEEVNRLSMILDNLQTKQMNAQSNLQNTSAEIHKQRTTIVTLQQKIQSLERENKNYMMNAQRLADDVRMLEEKIEMYSGIQQNLVKVKSLNEKYESESIHLRSKIQEITHTTQRTQFHLQDTLRNKDNQIDSLNFQLEQVSRKLHKSREQLRQVQDKNMNILEEIKKIQHLHHETLNSQSKQESSLRENYNNLIGKMEQQLKEMKKKNEDIRVQNSRLIEDYRRLQSQYKFRVESLQNLATRLSQYESKLQQYQKQANQRELVNKNNSDKLEERIRTSSEQIDRWVRQNKSLRQKIQYLEEIISQKEQLVEKQWNNIEEIQRKQQKEHQQLRKTIQILENKMEEQRKSMQIKIEKIVTEKNTQIQHHQRNIYQLENGFRHEKQKLINSHQQGQIQRQKIIKNLQIHNQELLRNIQQVQNASQQSHQLHSKQFQQQQVQINTLKNKEEQLRRALQNSQGLVAQLKEQSQRMASDNRGLSSRVNQEIQIRQRQLSDIEKHWRSEISHLQNDFEVRQKNLIDILHQRDEEINWLKTEVSNYRNKLEQLSVNLKHQQSNFHQKDMMKDQEIQRLSNLNQQLTNSIIPSLQNDIRNYQQIIQKTQQERAILQHHIKQETQYFEEQFHSLNQASQQKNHQIQRLRKQSHQQKCRLEGFIKELQQLQSQLQRVNIEKQEIKDNLERAMEEMENQRKNADRIECSAEEQRQLYENEIRKKMTEGQIKIQQMKYDYEAKIDSLKENYEIELRRVQNSINQIEQDKQRKLHELSHKNQQFMADFQELQHSYEAQKNALRNQIKYYQELSGNLQHQIDQYKQRIQKMEIQFNNYKDKVTEDMMHTEQQNEKLVFRLNSIIQKNEQYYATLTNYLPNINNILSSIKEEQSEILRKVDEGDNKHWSQVDSRMSGMKNQILELMKENNDKLDQVLLKQDKQAIKVSQNNFDDHFIMGSIREQLKKAFQDFTAIHRSLQQNIHKNTHSSTNITHQLQEIRSTTLRIQSKCDQITQHQHRKSADIGLFDRYQIENQQLRTQCRLLQSNYHLQIREYEKKINNFEEQLQMKNNAEWKHKNVKSVRKGNNGESRESTEGSNRDFTELQQQYEQKITLLSQQIERLHLLLDEKNHDFIKLEQQFKVIKHQLYSNPSEHEIDELKQRIMTSQTENIALQEKVSHSLLTITDLSTKLQQITQSYSHLYQRTQEIQQKINSTIIQTQRQCYPQNNQTQSTQYRAKIEELEIALSKLRKDNFQLKKTNYNFEVQFEKVHFLKQKVSILNEQLDRISLINVDLAQQLKQCRLSIGEQSGLERRLLQMMTTIVLMSSEIEALRNRIK